MNADVLSLNLALNHDDGVDRDLIVRLIEENQQAEDQSVTAQRVEIRDRNGDALLAFGDLAEISSISILGGSGNDTVTLDADSFGDLALPSFSFDGGAGHDRLVVDSSAATRWVIDGADSGRLEGSLSGSFSGVESLSGSAGNEDTFVIEQAGSLSGIMDGGAGGYDSLVLEGHYENLLYRPIGMDSGDVVMDGVALRFAGLEPVDAPVIGGTVTVDLTGQVGVDAVLRQGGVGDGGYDFVVAPVTGTWESIRFNAPAGSVNILLGSGNDSLLIDDLGTGLTFGLSVDGGGGADAITLDGSIGLGSGGLDIDAEQITVSGAVSTDGDIVLQAVALASDTVSGSSAQGVSDQDVAISVGSGASLSGAAVTLLARSTNTVSATGTGSSVVTAGATVGGSADIDVAGDISATGALSIRAEVVSGATIVVSGPDGLTMTGVPNDDIYVYSTNDATVDVGDVSLSGGTVEIAADIVVDVTVTVLGLTFDGLDFSIANIAVVSAITNTATVTLDAGATLTQAGSGTIGTTDAAVVLSATDHTDIDVDVSADAEGTLPLIDAVTVYFRALEPQTTIIRTVEVEYGDADAIGAATAPALPGMQADGVVLLSAATSGAVGTSAQTDVVGTAVNAVTENVRVRAKGVNIAAGGLEMSATAGSSYAATGQQATNSATGETVASLAYSTVSAGAGGVTLSASDNSTFLALALPSKFTGDRFDEAEELIIFPELAIDHAYAANLIDKTVTAVIEHSGVEATGDIAVLAVRALQVAAFGQSASVITSNSFFDTFQLTAAGSFVLNAVEGSVTATVANSDVTTTDAGGLEVSASEDSLVDGKTETQAQTLGGNGAALGFSVALTVLGWSTETLLDQVLAATLDTLMGTSFWADENAIAVEAKILDSSIDVVGALSVLAVAATQTNATVSNITRNTSSKAINSSSAGIGAIVSGARVSQSTKAYIDNGNAPDATIEAGGAVTVEATDSVEVYSNTRVVSASSAFTSGGLSILDNLIEDLSSADYGTTPESGQATKIVDLQFGDRVQLADDFKQAFDYETDPQFPGTTNSQLVQPGQQVRLTDLYDGPLEDFAVGDIYRFIGNSAQTFDLVSADFTDTSLWARKTGTSGSIYRYMGHGGDADIDLASADYENLDLWQEVTETSVVPTGISFRDSNTLTVGGTIVLNDVRGGATAYIEQADVAAASVTVAASEAAIIIAKADSTTTTSGGSSFGTGLATSPSRPRIPASSWRRPRRPRSLLPMRSA